MVGYDILNEPDIYPRTAAMADGQPVLTRAGARHFTLPDSPHKKPFGLPKLLAKPRVFVARKNKPLDIYGFHKRRIVSTRAKQLLCEIDPTAFDFAECETVTRKGIEVEPYWMLDIARVVFEFDEARSVFETAKGVDGVTGEPYDGPHIASLHDIHMSPNLRSDFHAFSLARYSLHMVFDQTLADAWRAGRLSGAEFLPLQPPTPKERRGRGYSLRYWSTGQFRMHGSPSA